MKNKPIHLSDHLPSMGKWIAIGYADWQVNHAHAWLIAPEAADRSLANTPALLRLAMDSNTFAEFIVDSVRAAFTLLHPLLAEDYVHYYRTARRGDSTEQVALSELCVLDKRAPGWGPVKSLAFVNAAIMESFPEAIPFLNLPTEPGRSGPLADRYIALIPQATAIMEKRQLIRSSSVDADRMLAVRPKPRL